MYELMHRDESIYRFKAQNIHHALAIFKEHRGISLIKVTRDGMPLSKFDFSIRRFVKHPLAR